MVRWKVLVLQCPFVDEDRRLYIILDGAVSAAVHKSLRSPGFWLLKNAEKFSGNDLLSELLLQSSEILFLIRKWYVLDPKIERTSIEPPELVLLCSG